MIRWQINQGIQWYYSYHLIPFGSTLVSNFDCLTILTECWVVVGPEYHNLASNEWYGEIDDDLENDNRLWWSADEQGFVESEVVYCL